MKKYSFSVLSISIAISFASFTTKENQVWYFAGTTTAQITDYTKYILNGNHDGCLSVGNAPCDIWVPETIDTPAELQTFLSDKSISQIMDLSPYRRALED